MGNGNQSTLEQISERIASTVEQIINPSGYYEKKSEGKENIAQILAQEQLKESKAFLEIGMVPFPVMPPVGAFWISIVTVGFSAYSYSRQFEGDPCALSVFKNMDLGSAFIYSLGAAASLSLGIFGAEAARYLSLRNYLQNQEKMNKN